MRTLYYTAFIPLVIWSIALLLGCGEDRQDLGRRVDHVLEDMDRDRGALRSELMELRKDIDARVLSTETALRQGELPEGKRAEHERTLFELEQNRDRVQQALTELEQADASSWTDVRKRTRKVTRLVDGWFEREAERADLASTEWRS